MAVRKWFPTKVTTVETETYTYEIGFYDHEKYGENCFRVTKTHKESGYFVGHFVVIPEDQNTVLPIIAEAIASLWHIEV